MSPARLRLVLAVGIVTAFAVTAGVLVARMLEQPWAGQP